MTSPLRPTHAQIDLSELRFNYRSSRTFIGRDVKYMAVVKANAYGHGAVQCAQALANEGIDWFGVALVEEGVELRNAGIKTPILCLGGFAYGQEESLLRYELTPALFNIDQARLLNAAATISGRSVKIHVKIDTGMGRLGIRWDQIEAFINDLKDLKALQIEGLMTHFASAHDLKESEFTNSQIDRFYESVRRFESAGFRPQLIDLANSPGAVAYPRSRSQMVRLGGILYGLGADVLPVDVPKPELRPVMSLLSVVADLKIVPRGETLGYGRTFTTERDSKIALVPIGYNDGYRRGLSNNACVLIKGIRVPVAGRISMDWSIVDATDVPNVQIGDKVTLIGRDGDLQITAEDLAARADTISYEITCGISSRVPRVYRNDRE